MVAVAVAAMVGQWRFLSERERERDAVVIAVVYAARGCPRRLPLRRTREPDSCPKVSWSPTLFHSERFTDRLGKACFYLIHLLNAGFAGFQRDCRYGIEDTEGILAINLIVYSLGSYGLRREGERERGRDF